MTSSKEFQSQINRVLSHKNPELLRKARNLIPLEKLQSKSLESFWMKQRDLIGSEDIDEAVLLETIFLQTVLNWFKNSFFKWYDPPRCDGCNMSYIFFHRIRDPNPAVDENEIYRCPKCRRRAQFKRYNDSNVLLDTRVGRCHEHSQIFALICKSVGYDTRMVFDSRDHIWNEVYSDLQRRWIHCDPSEGVLDKPLMYEIGWKKSSPYITAIGENGIQDVTWRYTSEANRNMFPKDLLFEDMLRDLTSSYQRQVLEKCTPARKKYLLTRLARELTDLMFLPPSVDGHYEGRLSGTKEWREQRGELGAIKSSHVGHTFAIPAMVKKFGVWYSVNADAYIVSNNSINGNDIVKGWKSLVHRHVNINRKLEYDWKMSYLAREASGIDGTIQWHFKADVGISITGVFVLTNFFTTSGGVVECIVTSSKGSSITYVNETSILHLVPSEELTVEIRLSGGSGENAWQSAQLGRQSFDNKSEVSFGILVYLQQQHH